ncbi:MAG: hypothetical protein VX777_09525 [Chlamydiota bacterium]|nr:hypothetical protein [Chlamydiota bacterium]
MHNNKIWLGFLAIMTLAVLWFTWGTAIKIYDYFSYKEYSKALNVRWKKEKIDTDHYLLTATYSFKHHGKNHEGEMLFEKPVYQNPWAAEQAITMNTAKPWRVWFSPSQPSRSTIIKKFPMKEAASTVILWGLWIYFLWLGVYVTQFKR